jgi:hypothetical protein
MTVEELEPRIGMLELVHWHEFEQDFGPMTLHERIDVLGATIAYAIYVAHGGKDAQPRDFLPQWQSDRPVDEVAWFRMMAKRRA